jgi:SAM-dependent methyltransferase
VEALRFLARRVEELEAAADRRRVPVLAPAALLAPPPVTPWVEPVADRLRVVPPSTGVLHAECGSGELVAALRGRGMTAFGAEPRGPIAWEAANRGVLVDIESAPDRLARVERGTLGGIVLSGVVDRCAVGDLVHLLATAVESLRPGGVLVVLSSDPEAPVAGWPAVARDLLPGRPLHVDTWHLLLSRAGLQDLAPLAPSQPADGYALSARREP